MNAVPTIRLDQDWHVHSRFSDGSGSLEENIAAAEHRNLSLLGCVDHVRADSKYVPSFATAVERLRRLTDIDLRTGVEAKLLDVSGELDLPPADTLDGVDLFVIADHQVPSPNGPRDPSTVRDAIAGGELAPALVVGWIIDATSRALERHPGALIAHLFSVLPKAGIDHTAVDLRRLQPMIRAAQHAGAMLEVSERWRTPSGAVIAAFAGSGVRIVASTDAHRPQDIGSYRYVRSEAEKANATPAVRPYSAGRA